MPAGVVKSAVWPGKWQTHTFLGGGGSVGVNAVIAISENAPRQRNEKKRSFFIMDLCWLLGRV